MANCWTLLGPTWQQLDFCNCLEGLNDLNVSLLSTTVVTSMNVSAVEWGCMLRYWTPWLLHRDLWVAVKCVVLVGHVQLMLCGLYAAVVGLLTMRVSAILIRR